MPFALLMKLFASSKSASSTTNQLVDYFLALAEIVNDFGQKVCCKCFLYWRLHLQ
jgi:hypothetical protein